MRGRVKPEGTPFEPALPTDGFDAALRSQERMRQSDCRLRRAQRNAFLRSRQMRYIWPMTELLDRALQSVRALPAAAQDALARILLELTGDDQSPVTLGAVDEASFEASFTEAERGSSRPTTRSEPSGPSMAYEAPLYASSRQGTR